MSNFQIGLAVAGGLVLAGVVAFNTWTARKNAPRQPETPQIEPVGLEPVEPTFSEDDLRVQDTPDMRDLALPTPAKKPTLDALIDVIASLSLDPNTPAVSGDAAIAALPATRRAGTKPFAVEGLNVANQQWEAPVAGQRYSGFQAGVQLANRTGALNEIEYSEFVVKTQAFADAVGATPDFPEMRDEAARARELDQFASAHDAQLGFTIRARNASWSPGYVHQNAARLGFAAGAIAGRMVLPAASEGMPPLLVLGFDSQAALAEDPAQSAIREISLHLDVAQAERAQAPFERMRDAAFSLAESMDGVVTDDNGQPLVLQDMDVIGSELQTLYNTLEQRDLAAGSAVARRLFS
jgi:ZipA, C-terminal FtsZ-binding domain